DVGRYEPGAVIGQLESVALGGGHREGRGRSVEPDESGGADDDAGGRHRSRQQRARDGTATDVAVADDQHRLGRRTVAQPLEDFPSPEWMEEPLRCRTRPPQQFTHHSFRLYLVRWLNLPRRCALRALRERAQGIVTLNGVLVAPVRGFAVARNV